MKLAQTVADLLEGWQNYFKAKSEKLFDKKL
jgi:hypothetical protein